MSRRPRPLPTGLVVGLALVTVAVSATTGAVAGSLVTSADIKDRTIKVVDLSPPAVKQLQGRRGQRGKPGATGPRGATGPAGAAGSALGWARIRPDGSVIVASDVTVVHTSPNGLYCLRYDGRPNVVTATIDPAGADSRKNIASASTDTATILVACGLPYRAANIVVYTADVVAGTAAQASFSLPVIA